MDSFYENYLQIFSYFVYSYIPISTQNKTPQQHLELSIKASTFLETP